MESLLDDIVELLLAVGPWVVLVATCIETAGFVGLLIPAEATVLLAAFMADRGYFELDEILVVTVVGGLAGDQIGYLLGRHGGARIAARGGRLGRVWRRHEIAATGLFQRHSALAVTFARFVSFIRTLMPWFAGMSRMPYWRFLAYDLLGVVGWAIGSVALGYAAGESWHIVAGVAGTAGGVIFVLLVATFFAISLRRRRRLVMQGDAADAPTGPAVLPPVPAGGAAAPAVGGEPEDS